MRTTPTFLAFLLFSIASVESFVVGCCRSHCLSLQTKRPIILASTPASPEGSEEPSSPSPPTNQKVNDDAPLDPLFVAVTRSDVAPAASTVSVPLLGELELDKSLFLFLPVAAFAIGGIGLSIAVFLNSGDSFATAIQETTAATIPPDASACRGICSDPDQSRKAVEQFLSGFPGK